jgi:hypothetical protein
MRHPCQASRLRVAGYWQRQSQALPGSRFTANSHLLDTKAFNDLASLSKSKLKS